MSGTFMCGGQSAPGDVIRILAQLRDCCLGAAEDGPDACTCWEPEHDLIQQDLRRDLAPEIRSEPCADCAYRPDSLERAGDERMSCSAPGELERIARDSIFWCHDGMRKPVQWRHRLGIIVELDVDHYDPPIREVDGVAVPFRANGLPGLQCAGWAARRRLLEREAMS